MAHFASTYRYRSATGGDSFIILHLGCEKLRDSNKHFGQKVTGSRPQSPPPLRFLLPTSMVNKFSGDFVTGTSWILNSLDKPKIPDPTSEQSARAAPPPPPHPPPPPSPPFAPLPSVRPDVGQPLSPGAALCAPDTRQSLSQRARPAIIEVLTSPVQGQR